MKRSDPLSSFSRDASGREAACIAAFGPEGSGKSRLFTTAGIYAATRGKVPGWIICDRKTRKTLRDVCAELGMEIPYINKEDFVSQSDGLALATNNDETVVKKIYTEAIKKVINAAVELGGNDSIEPIIFDSGTQLWDWIAFSHFGKKQEVGRARVWGPPKQDWTDLLDSLSHKTVLITLRSKDEWRNDNRTGVQTWDGPPHLGYTTTTVVRLSQSDRKLKDDETFIDRFSLDVVESQDNKGIESVNGILSGPDIDFTNLMSLLRPEE